LRTMLKVVWQPYFTNSISPGIRLTSLKLNIRHTQDLPWVDQPLSALARARRRQTGYPTQTVRGFARDQCGG
jgi:hypothetical protein